ncbi:ATP-binding response regulator [Flavobacterium channae]|uniref:ATP-binding response regulator n=1 Tax=Flavobacterium channae TaxID=2897181 RepID=UPI001E344ADD|nr:ATP-binding protein [Flavobacterium channae]UGS22544.1 ATP-binding protein [Flavobacterium channae]
MITSKRFLFVILLCISSVIIKAQTTNSTNKEAKELLKKAGQSFLKLETKKSLDFAQKALIIATKNNDDLIASKAYNLIGLNFEEFSDYQKAIEYYTKGLVLANKVNNDTVKGWLNNNLGNVYCYRKIDFHKGIKHYKEGLKYSIQHNDEYEIMFSKLNIGSAYFAVEDFSNGIQYFNEVKDYVDKNGDIESKISLNSNFGLYYNSINNNKKAEEYYLKAVQFCEQNDIELIKSNASDVYHDISNFYFKIKNFEKAHFYLLKHDQLQDEIYNEERLNEVKVGGMQIEHDEINRKIDQIEKEKEIQAEKLQANRVFVILLAIIFFILLLLLLSLIRNNKFKAKINEELKRTNNELLIAKEKAEEASQLKTQFISTISHELRTPLYGVVGITDIILDEHKELKNSPHLKSLKFSAKYLLSLVNDILKVYKIEENQVVLEDAVFNIQDELMVIKDSLYFLAVKNNNQIFIDVDNSIPEVLVGDKIRLSQIFINLMSNSLKFTENGRVVVKADLIEKIGTKCYLKFQVIDNGIGIAKEDQNKVFEKFVQVYRKEDDYQGTGLGLTIVKKLVELFNGTIQLESEEGKGTTITFTLPLDSDVSRAKSIIDNLDVDLSARKEYKILVVEDNKINQVVTKKLLENNHFKCNIVDDGYAALELISKTHFDAILMDINMPIINGFETSKLIRQKGIQTPIIAVTAFDKQDIEEKIIDAQIDEVIVKPFESHKLFETIKRLVDK